MPSKQPRSPRLFFRRTRILFRLFQFAGGARGAENSGTGRARASWIAAVPTPEPAAWTINVSPDCSPACVEQSVMSGDKGFGDGRRFRPIKRPLSVTTNY